MNMKHSMRENIIELAQKANFQTMLLSRDNFNNYSSRK